MLRQCLVSGISLAILSISLVYAPAGAWAQRATDIFVTPVPNAPFYGLVEIQRSFVRKNGIVITLKTTRLMARDSAGRIYTESRQLLPASSTASPALLRAHIYDPRTRVSTMLFPRHKMYRTFVVNRPPSNEPPGQMDASPAGANMPLSQFSKQEDLGTKEIDGLQAHGVRVTQTIPATGGGQPVVVTDEYWYSDYLHINLVLKHSDPRTGSVTMALTEVSQSEPDPSLFAIPEGYKPFPPMRPKPSKQRSRKLDKGS